MERINQRLLAGTALNVLGAGLAWQLTRWRGVERRLVLEVLIIGLAGLIIILLVPALKRGTTGQVLLAILLGFPAAFVLVNAFIQMVR